MTPSAGMAPAVQELGHSWLDVLKVDIEGSEFEVIHHLAELQRGMPFTQLQLEVHFGWNSINSNRQALALLYDLMSGGLRTFNMVWFSAAYWMCKACAHCNLASWHTCCVLAWRTAA